MVCSASPEGRDTHVEVALDTHATQCQDTASGVEENKTAKYVDELENYRDGSQHQPWSQKTRPTLGIIKLICRT